MSRALTSFKDIEKRFAEIGLEPNTPRERVYLLSALMGAEQSRDALASALNIETQVHKRVEEALAKAYIKGK